MSTFYELAVEYRQIGEDEDAPLEARLEILEAIEGDLKTKAVNSLAHMRNCEMRLAGLKVERDRIAKAIEHQQREIEGFSAYLKRCLEIAKIDKLALDSTFARYIARRLNPAPVVITNAEQIPQGYWRTHEPEPDKAGAAKAMRNGEDVPGFEWGEPTTRLEIK